MKDHTTVRHFSAIVMLVTVDVWLSYAVCFAQGATQKRETVLDRVTHLSEPLVTELPKVQRLCGQISTLTKRYVNIGDCKLYVETEGTGTPIVLINGGPGGTHHDFHPYFSQAGKFAKVIYYDQRGCGLSDFAKGKDGYSFPQAVDDLEKLREALAIDKWITVGWSYGGCLAQNYLLKYPERVAGLVLVGALEATPLSLKEGREYNYMTPEEQKKVREIWNNEKLTDEQKLFNAQMYGDWKRQHLYKPTSDELARLALYEWKHDRDFRDGITGTMERIEIPKVFDECPSPVLILEGAWDLTWNTDKAEKLHAVFPDSRLVLLTYAGHKMFGDQPEEFFKALKEFVINRRDVKVADIAIWKSRVENNRKLMEEENKRVSDEVTFRSSEKAPDGFLTWTFFWTHPKVDEGAKVGYVVHYDEGKEYYRWGPSRVDFGGTSRSDFKKEWTGKDASVLYGKDLTVKFWTTRGKIRFAEDINFECRDKDGKVIKRMGSVNVGK